MLLVWSHVGGVAHACVGMFMHRHGHVHVNASGQHWVEFLKHVLCLTWDSISHWPDTLASSLA